MSKDLILESIKEYQKQIDKLKEKDFEDWNTSDYKYYLELEENIKHLNKLIVEG